MTNEEQNADQSIIIVENKALAAVYDMVESLVKLGATNNRIHDAIRNIEKAARDRAILRLSQR